MRGANLDARVRRGAMINIPRRLFSSLKTLATPMALDALAAAHMQIDELLGRHFSGDWGDVDPDDVEANDEAIANGSRILSAYVLSTGLRIWVLTEAVGNNGTRIATTILLPSEY
jgi:hypothetical protein